MRRFFFAVALSTIAAAGPMQAWGGDREIAEQIIKRLKVQRDAGSLKGFTLDLKVEEGVVLFRGKVSNPDQKQAVLSATGGLDGVRKVVDEIAVMAASPAADAAPASTAVSTAPKASQPATAGGETRTAAAKADEAKPVAAKAEVTKPTAKKTELAKASTAKPQTVKSPRIEAPVTAASNFSFRNALAAEASQPKADDGLMMPWFAGSVVPAAASEESTAVDSDQRITSAVARSLADAQQQGRLRGFGVDVTTRGGDVWLTGRAASEQHKSLIMDLARSTAGVRNVIDDINVYAPQPLAAPQATPMDIAQQHGDATPSSDRQTMARPVSSVEAGGAVNAAHPVADPAVQVPYAPQPYQAAYGAVPMQAMGQPMPGCAPGMAGYAGAGVAGAGIAAPRYDQPYLPNYAWPGYAAYPNYAAVTYPQQYSPSAWPYIGPFYPYPQVPLGWRKVSLEWDDGWWFLDFTDR